MTRLTCRTCGRQVDTASTGGPLLAEERRCPRCGAHLTGDEPPAAAAPEDESAGRAVGGGGPMRVALLGFGLIGGSIARAIAAARASSPRTARGVGPPAGDVGDESSARAAAERIEIAAWSPSGSGPRAAAQEGLVTAAERAERAIEGADLVVLAAPPLACLALLDSLAAEWRPALRPDATVSDVASTKRMIVHRATALELPFVGGHPMAGREVTGYEAADAALFVGRPWVLVAGPTTRSDDLGRVTRLAAACGARPIRLGADEHDRATAAISHLPLVLSAALVEAVAGTGHVDGGMATGAAGPSDWELARTLAAGGWQGMTRLARGDAAMGAGILTTNADAVAHRVREVRAVLDLWLASLEAVDGPDPTALEARLRAVAGRLSDGGRGARERPDGA